jgi:hypothetical protein
VAHETGTQKILFRDLGFTAEAVLWHYNRKKKMQLLSSEHWFLRWNKIVRYGATKLSASVCR